MGRAEDENGCISSEEEAWMGKQTGCKFIKRIRRKMHFGFLDKLSYFIWIYILTLVLLICFLLLLPLVQLLLHFYFETRSHVILNISNYQKAALF